MGSFLEITTVNLRKIAGYGMGIFYFITVFIALIVSSIACLELLGNFGHPDYLNIVQFLCALSLLLCSLKDKYALRRILLRCEAYARNQSLAVYERALGIQQH
jgi:hypothetical protein